MSTQEPLVGPEHVLDSPEAGGRVIRGSAIRLSGFAFSLLVGVLTAPLLIRHLSVSDFGIYATANSIIFVIGGLSEGGIGSVAIREYTQGDATRRRRILESLLGLRLVLILTGCSIAIVTIIALGYPTIVLVGVLIGAVGIVVGATQATNAVPLMAGIELTRLTFIDIARQGAATITMVGLIIAGATLVPFYFVNVVGLVVMLVITAALCAAPRFATPRYHRRDWTHLLRQTGIFSVATAFSIIYFQVALISVAALSGSEQAGYYGASFRVIEILNGVPWLLATAAFPLIARSAATDAERLRYALQRMFEAALVAGTAFAVVLFIGAPAILEFLGAGKLDSALPVLRIMSLGVPFTFCIAVWSFALLSIHATRRLLISSGAALALAVVLSVVLIPRYGAVGGATVTLIVEVALAAMYGIALARERPELRVHLRPLLKVATATAAAVAAGLLIPLGDIVTTIIGFGIFAIIIVVTKAVPPELTAELSTRILRRQRP